MSDDYRVKPLSDLQVQQIAKKVRNFFGVADHRRVDILECLKSRRIWTVSGERDLNFQARPDREMGSDDGVTHFSNGLVTIAVKQSVRDNAFLGEGRSRNTLTHELGHGVMHDGPKMARRAYGNITPKWIRPYESAEHQAKVFAPAFLINDEVAKTLSNANEISVEFGISYESAEIYFEQLVEQRNRSESAEKVRRMADEFRALTAKPVHRVQFISDPCTACGKQTLFPVGIKFMCQTCNAVFDRFQDGDSLGP